MTEGISKDPAYKASVHKLDEAIAEHLALVEAWANEHGDTPGEDTSALTGWVLVMGTVGFNSENGEFHDALVETPESMNSFMAVGLAQYGYGFLKNETDNYSWREGEDG